MMSGMDKMSVSSGGGAMTFSVQPSQQSRGSSSSRRILFMTFIASIALVQVIDHGAPWGVDAFIPTSSNQAALSPSTSLDSGNDRWWEGINDNTLRRSKANDKASNQKQKQSPLITRQMEEEVKASARATVDSNTVSRAVASLMTDDSSGIISGRPNKSDSSLRDLALKSTNNGDNRQLLTSDKDSAAWSGQQIAIASGATTFLLSPVIIPIVHSLLPPIIPTPSSVSFTGAALLGTISYIIALGDPTEKSGMMPGSGGALGDGIEVGGAVSRIVGRTALQSVQTSAPRLKAAARALADYDTTTATLEELRNTQQQLTGTVLELEMENEELRKELAVWMAVEDISGMYKLEELKEMARYEGIKGYSVDGKNALLRRLVREGVLKLDLTPYIG